MSEKLRFLARGTAQVTDPHAQERGIRRCIARRWQEVMPGRWAWVPTEEPQAVDTHQDLVKACQDGDLWAADEATAKACRVPWDPNFGGEDTDTIKAFKARQAAAAAPAPTKEEKKAASASGKGEG